MLTGLTVDRRVVLHLAMNVIFVSPSVVAVSYELCLPPHNHYCYSDDVCPKGVTTDVKPSSHCVSMSYSDECRACECTLDGQHVYTTSLANGKGGFDDECIVAGGGTFRVTLFGGRHPRSDTPYPRGVCALSLPHAVRFSLRIMFSTCGPMHVIDDDGRRRPIEVSGTAPPLYEAHAERGAVTLVASCSDGIIQRRAPWPFILAVAAIVLSIVLLVFLK